ncbi:MAG: hypothetical protein O9327_03245 [Polaromonas sp.]|nr:hypothetical protein [Polaromonas sp.]
MTLKRLIVAFWVLVGVVGIGAGLYAFSFGYTFMRAATAVGTPGGLVVIIGIGFPTFVLGLIALALGVAKGRETADAVTLI